MCRELQIIKKGLEVMTIIGNYYQGHREKYYTNENLFENSSKSGTESNINIDRSILAGTGRAWDYTQQETLDERTDSLKQYMKYLFGWAFMDQDEYQKFCDEYNQDAKTSREEMWKYLLAL